ncbi:MAG: acetylornithine deacetylase, partial [Saprospiraceae bacterium]|nr:acetylornithine deacetylase [Saprospiraceae bacterium]
MNNRTGMILCLCVFGLLGSLQAQPVADDVYWATAQASFEQLKELLAIPNDAHYPEDIARNVQWCEAHFSAR